MKVRHEFKIPCPPTLALEIETWVRLHPAHWRMSYPPRQVNNIYFDTPDLQALNANLGGLGRREKLRLRWYGPDITRIANARPAPDRHPGQAAQLELKCKEGLVGWKQIAPLDGTLALAEQPWAALLTTLRAGLEPRAQLWLDRHSAPTLINHYQRAYYETPDGVLRLTLDTRLRAYDQRGSALPNLTRPALLPEYLVVEIKCPTDAETGERLAQALATFPVRVDRFSKYLHGMLTAADFEGMLA